MRRQRNVKILATLGPASSSPESIRRLFEAGADVFRLNFSHGSHADHRERFDIIRRLEQNKDRPAMEAYAELAERFPLGLADLELLPEEFSGNVARGVMK